MALYHTFRQYRTLNPYVLFGCDKINGAMERRNKKYIRCKFLMMKVYGVDRKELTFTAIFMGRALGNFWLNNIEERMKDLHTFRECRLQERNNVNSRQIFARILVRVPGFPVFFPQLWSKVMP